MRLDIRYCRTILHLAVHVYVLAAIVEQLATAFTILVVFSVENP